MAFFSSPRSRTVFLLAAGAFVLGAAIVALNAFNPRDIRQLTPQSSDQILVFSGLSIVVFLLLVLLLVLLIRNLLKLFVDQRSRALGSRLRTRLVLGAALISLAPATFMFLYSFALMNRSVDRWFSQPTAELRSDSDRVVSELAHYAATNARLEAEAIAASSAVDRDEATADSVLRSRSITLEGGYVAVYDASHRGILGYQLPAEEAPRSLLLWLTDGKPIESALRGPVYADILAVALRSDEPVLVINQRDYVEGQAMTPAGRIVVVGLPMPQGLSETASRIRAGTVEYWTLFRSRNRIRETYFFMLLLITALVFFSSMWLALFLSKQITRPVEALADAMDEIAEGKLDKRVAIESSGEMAELMRAFNHMAGDLQQSREVAESAREQLAAANMALESRRRELETILETIPSGVVTLDAFGAILLANHAFAQMLGEGAVADLIGRQIVSVFAADCAEDLGRVIRRSHRMGTATVEMQTQLQGRNLHLTVTSARLSLGAALAGRGLGFGSVLVVEDTSELLRAQRQLAWKEVAQRVAHEIKNPLTPIALSAERIKRHLDRTTEDSPAVIRKCSEVILSCVTTLRTLVDQFSALAQFPASRPSRADVNSIVENSLTLFHDRLDDIKLRKLLDPELPPVMADGQALQRALANLIDNAAEAMQGSLLRVLTVQTRLTEDAASVEIEIADTGHGLTDEIRERLFLPFYSTKQRGTGLGLSIAAKIIQDHQGSIRAESNAPKGARFLVTLPVLDTLSVESAAEASAAEETAETPEQASKV